MYWLEFLISAAMIIWAGARLTVCADRISDALGLGKVWIGVALLGVVTSLPEAIASLTAILSLHANDLAVGNLVGSNNFNPTIIVAMDILYRQGSVTNAVRPNVSHEVSARYAIGLALLVVFDMGFNRLFPALHIGPLSLGTMLIAVFYFIGMKQLARLGAGQSLIAGDQAKPEGQAVTTRRLWIEMAFNAGIVVIGAMWLAKSADMIALETGLGRTFVGSIFLALVTSLPEMVVSLSAMRLGAFDLAIGNIFGSNMANMFILSFCGLFYPERPILATVSVTHAFTVALSAVLALIVLKGIFARDKKTVLGFGWDTALMSALFVAGTFFLYYFRGV